MRPATQVAVTAAVLVAVVVVPAVTSPPPEGGGGAAVTEIVRVAGALVPAALVARSVTVYEPAVA